MPDFEPKPSVAICPGSYDPVTNGHMDIIARTATIFDHVVVGVVGRTIRKQQTLFSADERADLIATALADSGIHNTEVKVFKNLLVDFARDNGARAVVKGIRAISDFEYELEMNQINRRLASDIESMYLFASPEFSFLSSTGVKEMATFGADISELVPANAAAALSAKLSG